MTDQRNGQFEDLFARQRGMEERIQASENRLAIAIDSLAQAVAKLNEKINTFVDLHQKFVFNILILVGCIFLGKEVVGRLVDHYLINATAQTTTENGK